MKLDIEMRTSQYTESDDDDDSTTDSEESDYIPYKDRPEWADVEPDSIRTRTSIMDIKYTSRYEEVFSYFRAMLAKDELSERSLALTADCIELQRSNFSVWYFRRRILNKLRHHLNDELKFVGSVIEDEPKNYQVWHHRKVIVEWLHDGTHDKQLTASVLVIDSKNYHAWQHRQWVIKEFNLWDGEIEYTDTHLAMDARNNSAWNHKFYVVKETQLHKNQKWINEELARVHEYISRLTNNESSWSYLRGILMLTYDSLIFHKGTLEFIEDLISKRGSRSIHLLGFKLDVIRERVSRSEQTDPVKKSSSLKLEAHDICRILIDIDKVRSRYWEYIDSNI